MTARIEKAEIIEALRASAGIGTKAAEILGCTRQAISARIAADPELQEAQRNARQLITDVAESNIIRSITKGDLARSQWWLRTQERERFGDRVEAVGPNGGPLQIQSSVSLDWEKLPLEALIAIRNEAKNQRGGGGDAE